MRGNWRRGVRRWTVTVAITTLLAALTACEQVTITEVLSLLQGGVAVADGELAYDFGPVDPGDPDGVTVSLTLSNDSPDTIAAVDSITVSPETDYTLDLPDPIPALGPGETLAMTLTFHPTGSGTKDATLTVSSAALGAIAVDVTGQGNYPRSARFQVVVSGAGSTELNGTYTWDPTAGSLGAYTMESGGTTYYLVAKLNGCQTWYLGDDPGITTDADSHYYNFLPRTGPPPEAGWSADAALGSPPMPAVGVAGTGIRDAGDREEFWDAFDNFLGLVATYVYDDPEGDLVDSASYQWQETMDSSYTPVDAWTDVGTDQDSYTSVTDERWYRVMITPQAATGTTAGEPALSPPVLASSLSCG